MVMTGKNHAASARPVLAGPEISLQGERVVPERSGALWLPEFKALLVADMHLEKSSAVARRTSMRLPPWDSLATLRKLVPLVGYFRPEAIISLGDSFHDNAGSGSLEPEAADVLADLAGACRMVWITGNHDTILDDHLPGETLAEMGLGSLTLRHIPAKRDQARGEIAGHFHPKIRLRSRGGILRSACFVCDGYRMLLPAFGALSGGLDAGEPVIADLFGENCLLYVPGGEKFHRLPLLRKSSRKAR